MNDTKNVVSTYTLQQAIEDGVLVEVFKNRWATLSGGKPIVATSHVSELLSLAALQEIWNGYVSWKGDIRPTLAEEDQIFSMPMDGKKVWVLEDGDAHTIMYPEDY